MINWVTAQAVRRNLLNRSWQAKPSGQDLAWLLRQKGGPMADIDVSSSQCPGHGVVALRGELDVSHAAWLARALPADAAPGSRIIMDIAELTFKDCCSLSALVSARKQALQSGGDLLPAGPWRTVLRLLSRIDQDGLLPAFASVDGAANGARKSAALGWLAVEQAGSEASLGNGEVNPAADGASPTGPQYFAMGDGHGERRPP